ncbi:hypothetical protein ACJIZ3_024848 [Penstemon smallii]|uniref:Kinesin-like protein n=1 Tax=Penstemon smallii TaxID=265156 RepID=A0ABD3TT06_9LAMI
MGSISGESMVWDAQDSNAHEEKIFVAIRLRPLNEREIGKNDVSDWECINNTTVIFKNTFQERSMFPSAYTFDRVFGSDCPTRKVYEDAAKRFALSVLSGMNSTIFAYGQTSSGKTYTMSGITEYAVADIYDYIDKHPEREFVLKFSAMEIYNEVVKDLLTTDGTPLRLLDDPERGTVIDKLTEVTVRDSSHLIELLSICESQRQIGETTLNEMSSRSHQILRLIVESEAREYFGAENSSTLTASVNFVDLAGSERLSQTMSAGTRLKEGCHINRSLLTLGTVIRKLSKGRNAHIPYRDSKLTRILQNSLGGNAKTAIICTMSPAHSHLEQSRKTLLFASCAKRVSNNAQVNIVVSEKALVKQLQRELARLENELKNLSSLAASCDSTSALKEKELLIEKMDKEIRELRHQRDLAQSRALRPGPKSWVDMNIHEKDSWTDECSVSEASEIIDPLWSDVASSVSHFSDRYRSGVNSIITEEEDTFLENNEERFLSDDTSPSLYIDKYFGPDPCQGWEKIGQESDKNLDDDNVKDVQCIEIDFTKLNLVSGSISPQKSDQDQASGKSPTTSDEVFDPSLDLSRSSSSEEVPTTITQSTSDEVAKENKDALGTLSSVEKESENLCRKDSQDSTMSEIVNENEQIVKTLDEDCKANQQEECVKEFNEVIKLDLVKDIEDNSVPEDANNKNDVEDAKTTDINQEKVADDDLSQSKDVEQPTSEWDSEFEKKKREIIELWNGCNIPLVHRTYFFLLFKGDPSDVLYLDVELRRLSFINNALHGAIVLKDDQSFTQASSAKALNREREMLSRRMLKKYSKREREILYQKWNIDIKSKQRRLQLCRMLWTDATNMEHIKKSASIVAKLVGFKEAGSVPKEMIGLSFVPKPESFGWRHSLPSMM